MYKRQHYALEHSEKDSPSSGSSSSSLDTASDADSGGPEHVNDAAWPVSSHESDDSTQEEGFAEVQSAASVALRRSEAIKIAERKLAEAAEDEGEFEDELANDDSEADRSYVKVRRSDGNESDESEGDSETRETNGTNRTVVPQFRANCDSNEAESDEEPLAGRKVSNQWAEAVDEDELERILDRFEGNTVICLGDENKVFKCKICPKVVCLNEETMQAHLASKGHSRSMKQLAEGRLKIQLDSDGEEDEDGETHAERYARTVAAAQDLEEMAKKRKRDSGRQRQRNREKVKKKRSKSGTDVVPGTTQNNRKERRAILQAASGETIKGEAKSHIKKRTKSKKREKLSRVAANGESDGKKKRPTHT